MGHIVKGINGGFSGKAGSVIGARWRKIDYIRGLPRRSGKQATQKQLEQKLKFALLASFLSPLKSLLEKSYRRQEMTCLTGYNLAFHHNFVREGALTGVYPGYGIDYSKIEISRGSLLKPIRVIAWSPVRGEIVVSWSGLANGANAFDTDKAMIVLYNTQKKVHILSVGEGRRADSRIAISVPEEFSNDNVEVFIFFTSQDGKKNSPTAYGNKILVS